MASLATVQGSSNAYASVPNQYADALGSGWILDQRLATSTGGFVTNTSPTSSGLTFTSSGDGTTGTGTAFYAIGRPVRVLQSGSSAYAKVASASVSLGITTVTLSGFSTNWSTALSTGAITSAAVAPVFRYFATSGDLIYAGASASPTILPIGSSGNTLQTRSGFPAWVSILETANSYLTADTASTSTGTFKDILSISLTTGTWWVTAKILSASAIAGGYLLGKLWDGSTTVASDQGNANASTGTLYLNALVPASTSTTWKVSTIASLTSTTLVASAATPLASQGNNATYINAWKISAST